MRWRMLRQFAGPAELSDEFAARLAWAWKLPIAHRDRSAAKLLLESVDGRRCEAVALFPRIAEAQGSMGPLAVGTAEGRTRKLPRATACISSQPGCGVGCPFCATGELGYQGNLSAIEIAEQVYWAGVEAARVGCRLRNVVFMGMGEPLHNLPNVLQALGWLTSAQFFGLAPRHLTVSTAGVPQAMLTLARVFPAVRQALSLHAVDADLRRQLVPRAVGDLPRLREVIRQVNALQPTHPVWLEVVLFEDVNDHPALAQALVQFCQQLRVEVNLIPYNLAAGSTTFRPASRERREAFAAVLRGAGIRTTIRTSLGGERQAACGQLTAGAGTARQISR